MISSISAAEWQLEYERVLPKLKTKALSSLGKEWRNHLEQTTKHMVKIGEILPETSTQLSKLGGEVAKLIDRISIKERAMNRDFSHLCIDFSAKKEELDTLTRAYEELSAVF